MILLPESPLTGYGYRQAASVAVQKLQAIMLPVSGLIRLQTLPSVLGGGELCWVSLKSPGLAWR